MYSPADAGNGMYSPADAGNGVYSPVDAGNGVYVPADAGNGVEHHSAHEHHGTEQPQREHVITELVVTHA